MPERPEFIEKMRGPDTDEELRLRKKGFDLEGVDPKIFVYLQQELENYLETMTIIKTSSEENIRQLLIESGGQESETTNEKIARFQRTLERIQKNILATEELIKMKQEN